MTCESDYLTSSWFARQRIRRLHCAPHERIFGTVTEESLEATNAYNDEVMMCRQSCAATVYVAVD